MAHEPERNSIPELVSFKGILKFVPSFPTGHSEQPIRGKLIEVERDFHETCWFDREGMRNGS